eukprot:Selendium_serpulae@DN5092_c0_g1_i6.p2
MSMLFRRTKPKNKKLLLIPHSAHKPHSSFLVNRLSVTNSSPLVPVPVQHHYLQTHSASIETASVSLSVWRRRATQYQKQCHYTKWLSARQREDDGFFTAESSVSPVIRYFGFYFAAKTSKAAKVLRIKMATVIGPTPPGTGVMSLHFDATWP